MDEIFIQLNERPISYRKFYTKITGRLTAGVLLSQLSYWWSAMKGKEFYKTDQELIDETGLTKDELKAAKKILIEKKLVKTTLKGIPAKTYYTLQSAKIIKLLQDQGEENYPAGLNVEAWERWVRYRIEIRKKMKQTTIDLQIKKLLKYSESEQEKMLNTAMEKGWTGFFEPKNKRAKGDHLNNTNDYDI